MFFFRFDSLLLSCSNRLDWTELMMKKRKISFTTHCRGDKHSFHTLYWKFPVCDVTSPESTLFIRESLLSTTSIRCVTYLFTFLLDWLVGWMVGWWCGGWFPRDLYQIWYLTQFKLDLIRIYVWSAVWMNLISYDQGNKCELLTTQGEFVGKWKY